VNAPPAHVDAARDTAATPRGRRRALAAAIALVAVTSVSLLTIDDPILARVAALGGGALVLWLSEVVPPYVPTLALVGAIPLVLGTADPRYRLGLVLTWAADPVLALFFGGFALGLAASRHRIDESIAGGALALSRHRRRRLLVLVMAATALLSMWMSNIAAAAMMLAALRPHLHQGERTESFRRALLLGVAMAANFGGMSTPIGTGPNGIAIAQVAPWRRITFIEWMAFALPLMIAMLALAYLLIVRAHRVGGTYRPVDVKVEALSGRARGVVVVFALAVAAWLAEPLHGVPAPVVALAAATVLFGGGWLGRDDLGRIDWSTLVLIAGGLVLGRLVETSGLAHRLAGTVSWYHLPPTVVATVFVSSAALMSAVMSNTASAAILIPLALGLDLPGSMAVLIAIGTAFGVAFAISTPPNAMAYGEGGLSTGDLLRIGLPLMLVGCLVVGLTGPAALAWIGLR
jgi:sodium-dependent dicarboxylate transporter 2/3/5